VFSQEQTRSVVSTGLQRILKRRDFFGVTLACCLPFVAVTRWPTKKGSQRAPIAHKTVLNLIAATMGAEQSRLADGDPSLFDGQHGNGFTKEVLLSNDDFVRKLRRDTEGTSDTDEESTYLDNGSASSGSYSYDQMKSLQARPACFGGWIVDHMSANGANNSVISTGNSVLLTPTKGVEVDEFILETTPTAMRLPQKLPEHGEAPPSPIAHHDEDAPPPPPPHPRINYIPDPSPSPPRPPTVLPTPPPQRYNADDPVSPLASYGSPPRDKSGRVFSPDQHLPHPLNGETVQEEPPSFPPTQIFCSGMESVSSWVGDSITCGSGMPNVICGGDEFFKFDFNRRDDEDEVDGALLLPINRKEQLLEEASRSEQDGNLPAAKLKLEEIFELIQEEGNDGNEVLKAEVHHKMGVLRWKEGAYEDALQELYDSIELYERAFTSSKTSHDTWSIKMTPGERAETVAEVLISIGKADFSREEYGRALKSFKKAIKVMASVLPAGDPQSNIYHPSFARAATCLGMVYDARGQYGRAMEFYERGLLVQRATVGSAHVDVAATLNSIGSIKEKSAEYDIAMDCYNEALWIYRKQCGRGALPVDIAVTLNNLGFIYFVWGEYSNAMRHYTEALSIMENNLGPDHRNVASTLFNMAKVHSETGEYDRALQMFKQVLKSQRTSLGDHHSDVAVTLDSIADNYERQGRFDKSVQFLERALRIRRAALGETHLFVGMSLVKKAKIHLKMGQKLAARSNFMEADALFEEAGLDAVRDSRRHEVQEYLAAGASHCPSDASMASASVSSSLR